MRYSQLLIPTVKEVPAEAEIPSHRLMIRAGYIRKVASGTYTYLPLGWRSLQKIAAIVREEMNAAGAQEIHMPALQPIELWQRTGRDVDYGETMCRFTDRHGRVNVLGPTHEEVVTTLVAAEVRSYKQLPINLYQIQTKFRDEFRPRFGVLRSREFLMKDAYSFDAGLDALEACYRKMYDAYCRIFARCGLKYVVVEAESGPIGGSASHEFMVPCENGEDVIVHTADHAYAANIERADVDPPPRRAAPGDAPPMEEVHTPDVGTIEAVCAFLKTRPEEMIKTLIYWYPSNDEVRKKMAQYAVAHKDGSADHNLRASLYASGEYGFYAVMVRGDHEVNEGKLRRIVGRPIGLVDDEYLIEMVTHAKRGFAGPMGLLQEVDVVSLVIDHAVAAMGVGVTGANRTDHHTRNVLPGRDFPLEGPNVLVADIRKAVPGDTRQGKPLSFSHGIEVGHVFKLGTKYSVKLGATFLDEAGAEKPCVMGCYGIGINRILAAAIEIGNDKNGCILPVAIAPFELLVLPINNDSAEVVAEAERIYNELAAAGVDVLLDDRPVRAGVKFKDADLIGIPLRVAVGERGLKEGKVEIKRRTDAKPALVPAADAVAEAQKILAEMTQSLEVRGER